MFSLVALQVNVPNKQDPDKLKGFLFPLYTKAEQMSGHQEINSGTQTFSLMHTPLRHLSVHSLPVCLGEHSRRSSRQRAPLLPQLHTQSHQQDGAGCWVLGVAGGRVQGEGCWVLGGAGCWLVLGGAGCRVVLGDAGCRVLGGAWGRVLGAGWCWVVGAGGALLLTI